MRLSACKTGLGISTIFTAEFLLSNAYAIVQKDESVVDSVSMLNVGDEVDIKLSDGSVSANITFVK